MDTICNGNNWNATKKMIPTIKATNAVAMFLLKKLIPKTIKPKLIVERAIANQSTFGLVTSNTLVKFFSIMNKPINRKMMNDQKIYLHDNAPKIIPEIVGPIAGANIITRAAIPRAAPSLSGGKILIAIENISGKIIPVAIPWIILPAKSIGKFIANAEIAEPTMKSNKPNLTNPLVEKCFVNKLESGKTIAITSI